MRLLVVCCSPNLWLKLGDLGVSLAVVKNVTARWSLVAWLVLIAVSTTPIAIRTGSEVVGKITIAVVAAIMKRISTPRSVPSATETAATTSITNVVSSYMKNLWSRR